ncbi:sensor histidine kinase [Vagococcus silagei]|uniref:histidine kinase n=1 Tax=Vagococcus silagei TaxID=2508885 RepID=A0A4S3B7T2_9ENTE|nr:sensor histidine kinase [Vagococcus silagei]THB62120.1 HAMP domain-containing histidine kinase [Vagococcus silagei]
MKHIKRQLGLIFCIYFFLLLFFILIWLDGYHNLTILLYGFLLSTVFMGLFISLGWYRRRILNQLFDQKRSFKEFHQLKQDQSRLSHDVYRLMDAQYRYFYDKLKKVQLEREEQQHFIYRWVHQMKTPLSVIELMLQDEDYDIDSFREETDKLHKGLNLALSMSRLEAFQNDFHIETISLNSLIKSVINDQKEYLIRQAIFPKVEIDENLMIQTDKKWLAFAIDQLLINSVKYTTEAETRLDIFTVETSTTYELTIKDYGVGIASQDIKRVFDPFFTGKMGRTQHEATGMGLYLVKKVITQLDYSIQIKSEINQGTVVSIAIPKH